MKRKILTVLMGAVVAQAWAFDRPGSGYGNAGGGTFYAGSDDRSCDDQGNCTLMMVVIKNLPYQNSHSSNSVRHHLPGGDYRDTWYDAVYQRAGAICSKSVVVPRQLYHTINVVMASVRGEDGLPPPALTPTQQTLVLLYTTLAQQLQGFTCDLGNEPTPPHVPEPQLPDNNGGNNSGPVVVSPRDPLRPGNGH